MATYSLETGSWSGSSTTRGARFYRDIRGEELDGWLCDLDAYIGRLREVCGKFLGDFFTSPQ